MIMFLKNKKAADEKNRNRTLYKRRKEFVNIPISWKRAASVLLCITLLIVECPAALAQNASATPPAYMRRVSRMVANAPIDGFGSITLTAGESRMTENGEEREISDDPQFVPVLEPDYVGVPAPAIDPDANEDTLLTQQQLEEQGYTVSTDLAAGTITVTDPFSLCRLVVQTTGGRLGADYGAKQSVALPNDTYAVQYADKTTTEEAYARFCAREDIVSCVPDQIVSVSAQSGQSSAPTSWGTVFSETDDFAAHLQDAGDRPQIVVAVVDTGVDWTHPFLRDRIQPGGWDFVDDDDDPMDGHYHGTHCAGIVRDATPENIRILPIRVLDGESASSMLVGDLGIAYAIEQGADVVSMSFGAAVPETLIEEELQDLHLQLRTLLFGQTFAALSERETVLVAAAGNSGIEVARCFPAAFDEVISVGSVNEIGFRSSFSNYGDELDVCAPGERILSSVPGGGFEKYSGTSMAAPLAAACAALLLAEDPGRTREQVREQLAAHVCDRGLPGKDPFYGAGIVHLGADKVLQSLQFTGHCIQSFPYSGIGLQIRAEPVNARDASYTLEVSDPSVVEAASRENFTALNAGTAELTVCSADGRFADKCIVEVMDSGAGIRKVFSMITNNFDIRPEMSGLIELRSDGTAWVLGKPSVLTNPNHFGYYAMNTRLSWFPLCVEGRKPITGIENIWLNGSSTFYTDKDGTLRFFGNLDDVKKALNAPILLPDGSALTGVVDVAGFYALCADGTVWRISSSHAEPVTMADGTPLSGIRTIHECTAIRKNGEAFGLSKCLATPVNYGELDLADVVDVVVVPGISVSETNTPVYILLRDGTLWVYGKNDNYNRLGIVGTQQTDQPMQVLRQLRSPLTGVKQIRLNGGMFALCSDGTVWTWGGKPGAMRFGYGKGYGETYLYPQRMRVSEQNMLTGVTELLPGYGDRMLVLRRDGSVWWTGKGQMISCDNNHYSAKYELLDYAAPAVVSGKALVLEPDAEYVPPVVYNPVAELTIASDYATLRTEETFDLQAQTFPANADNNEVWFCTDNPRAAVVSDDGVITAVNPGRANVYAVANGTKVFRLACAVTVLERSAQIPGDVDGDGVLTLRDVALIRRFLAGGWQIEIDLQAADANADGVVNLKDVAYLLRMLAGWQPETS